MSKNVYPTGWDEARVKGIIAHYEAHPDSEETLGYDASIPTTMIEVTADLLPAIRYLIADHEGAVEADYTAPEPAGGTEWRHLEAPADWTEAAVYEIRLAGPDGAPIPIRRFLGVDARGILCIGQTGRMEKRRIEFEAASKGPGAPHSEAIMLRRLKQYAPLEKRYPGARYEYRYFSQTTPSDAREQEKIRIKEYICRFGEVPPLNSGIPDRHNDEGWQGACQRVHGPNAQRPR